MSQSSIRSEFKCTKFGFTGDVTDSDVYQLKFARIPVPVLIAYRWLISLYFIASLIVAGINAWEMYHGTVRWFIYLTNWTWLLCTLYYVAITLMSSYYYVRRDVIADSSILSTHARAVWVLFDMSFNVSIVLMILFWSMVVEAKHYSTTMSTFRSVNEHAVNVVLLLIDFTFHRIPVRIFHVIYPIVFGVTYLIFSIIYTLVTKYPIYSILDWATKPGWAAVYAIIAIVVIVIIQPLLYGLYRLKLLCCGVGGGGGGSGGDIVMNEHADVESGGEKNEQSDLVKNGPVTRYVEETN